VFVVVSVAASVIAIILWRTSPAAPAPARAAIIDQLAFTDPNPEFVARATQQLEDAGYAVDYVPPEDVTIDLYRNLPGRGYKFVLLRSHSSDFVAQPAGADGQAIAGTWSIGLFTNEPYSTQEHVDDQSARRAIIERYVDREISEAYFGVNADFIALSTQGRFNDATIVLMGCAGLKTDDLARAFMFKGATHFVSWDASVTAQHTDAATEKLLQYLFGQGAGLQEAVTNTMADVGPDPAFGAHLLAYP